MSAVLLPLWLVLCAVAAALAVRTMRASRTSPNAPAPRHLLAAIPLIALGLIAVSVTVLAIAPASDGAKRMENGESRVEERSPARARLFLRQVRIDSDVKRIGYSPDADVSLPSLYRLVEAVRAWDLLQLERDGETLTLTKNELPEETPTRIRLLGNNSAPTRVDLRNLARSCADASPSKPARGAVVAAALCAGTRPRAVLTFEASQGGLLLSALVWRRGRLEPHHIEIEPEALIQIGAAGAAVPGVTMWEVPSPAGRSELFSAPSNLLGDCASFASSVYAGASSAAPVLGSPNSAVCVVPFAPPFALEVRRLRPDVAGVTARSVWTAAMLSLPMLGFALLLFLRRRSESDRAAAADLLRVALISIAAVSVFAARLLWSHRIDMLRDWEVLGARSLGNLSTVVCVFSAIALATTLAALRDRPNRFIAAVLVFLCAAFAGWLTAPASLGWPDSRALGQFALAAAFGSVSLWRPTVGRIFDDSPHRVAVAIAAVALTTHLIAPRAVAIKLLLCTVAVVAGYRALRDALQNPAAERLIVGLLATGAMLVSLAVLDTGLAAVIAVPGMFVALALAGHDALFAAKALTEVKGYRLRQAPLLWLQGGLLGALVLAMLIWSIAGLAGPGNPNLARDLTLGAPHLLWLVAALFAAPALVAHRRGDTRTAALFGGAAALVACSWFFRDQLAELVLSSSAPAAQRYAVIADPGYSLLADPRAFLSGITGWAETIFGAGESAFVGAGFFGAQLIDPGVLLSVENDYLPILILRELGVLGMALWAVTSLALVVTAWLAGRELTSVAGPAARARLVMVSVVVILLVYQPLASLGALPLTGVSWLGLGVDSPSDLWMMLGILGYLAALGTSAAQVSESRHEKALRQTRRFVRKERWVAASAALAAVAGVLLVARASAFAVTRPMPVAESGVASTPFVGLEVAIDYARALRCTVDEKGALTLIGNPSDRGTRRFHKRFKSKVDGRTLKVGDALRHGLVTLSIHDAGAALLPTCEVTLERRALRALRVAPNRPFRRARVRLVSEPMGRAAGDHGELVSGDVAIRLRASADALPMPTAAGAYAGKSVTLGKIVIAASSAGEVTVTSLEDSNASEHWLFVAGSNNSSGGVLRTEETSGWTAVGNLKSGSPVTLEDDALLVIGRGAARNVWLFRAPRENPLDNRGPRVGSLLADDARSVTGARRRLYVYGSDLPELGWVNPFRTRGSVGLDGWVAAALAEFNPDATPPEPQCGTLAPPKTSLTDVCTPRPSDGLIECRVSVQPELTIRMRHLSEMIAAAPADFVPAETTPRPLRASFTLIRGDTGEIAAQGSFVPGRSSSAYAPTTAALETHLIRLREDRDPETGVKQPRTARGEASAEKVEHNRPIAIGSIFKPMLARAFEQTAPTLARRLLLTGSPTEGASCRGGKGHAVFGHCPPTDSLWNQRRSLSLAGFVGNSANWFMAAIAMVGTSLPNGEAGLGDGPPLELDELLTRNVGDHAKDWALWTSNGGKTVIDKSGKLNIKALRSTPFWQRFEALLGRPLCEAGNKTMCERQSSRRDVCAARGLAITNPSSDLRQLVSLGPSHYDLYPRLKNKERTLSRVPTREYLQFLRGSGIHRVGSLSQLTDAFNRVIFEARRDPLRDGPYQLAATWFPGPVVGEMPEQTCADGNRGNDVAGGVCEVVRTGTAARALRPLLADSRIEIFGAKTGTVDSLGDIATRKKRCERFKQSHTLTDRRRTKESQPYWLECGNRAEVDDSLLVVSFAIKTSSGGRIPMTLGLSFQRAGSGFASHVARHYIDVIADYFAAGEKGLP